MREKVVFVFPRLLLLAKNESISWFHILWVWHLVIIVELWQALFWWMGISSVITTLIPQMNSAPSKDCLTCLRAITYDRIKGYHFSIFFSFSPSFLSFFPSFLLSVSLPGQPWTLYVSYVDLGGLLILQPQPLKYWKYTLAPSHLSTLISHISPYKAVCLDRHWIVRGLNSANQKSKTCKHVCGEYVSVFLQVAC